MDAIQATGPVKAIFGHTDVVSMLMTWPVYRRHHKVQDFVQDTKGILSARLLSVYAETASRKFAFMSIRHALLQ